MDYIMNYVKPELIVVAIVLYLIGNWIKSAEAIDNKVIPAVLGIIGMILSAMWVFATTDITGVKDGVLAVFTALVQGILLAGLSVYADQIVKQTKK